MAAAIPLKISGGEIQRFSSTDTVPATNGGTGFGSFVVGDILSADTTTTWSKIAAVAAGSFLRSAGTSTLPAWSTSTWPNTITSTNILYAIGTNALGSSTNFQYDGSRLAVASGGNTSFHNGFGFSCGNTASVPSATHPILVVSNSQNGVTDISIANTNTGNAAFARLMASANVANGYIDVFSSGYSTSGTAIASGVRFTADGAGGLILLASHASGAINFYTGGSNLRGGISSAGVWTINTGVNNDSSGVKHARVTTGSISGGSTSLVTVTWATAFADANYTVQAQVQDSTSTSLSLSVVHIESISASAVTVRVLNNAVTSLTGTLHVTAIHD